MGACIWKCLLVLLTLLATYILPVWFDEDIQFHFVLLSELEWTRDVTAQVTVLQWEVDARSIQLTTQFQHQTLIVVI